VLSPIVIAGPVDEMVFGEAVIVKVSVAPTLGAIEIQVTSVCPVPFAAQAAL